MKTQRNIALFLTVVLLFLSFAGPMGCGDSDHTTHVKTPPSLDGDTSPFNGSLLQTILSGLLKGALHQIGDTTMGYILELLGWGGSGGDDQQYLDAMSQKLDDIISLLGDIKKELGDILNEINISMDMILENTNNPTNAITEISSTHERLEGLSKNSAGSIDQTTLADFTNVVENVDNIYDQVDAIYFAVIPATSVTNPVLDNFVNLALAEENNNTNWENVFVNSYLGIEQYFSQLLYYQMEGVNLIIETKIYREKAGKQQVDGRTAKEYMDFFTTNKLQPEVDNFMNNVYRLILSQTHNDLVNSNNFLPSETEDILSRANFFRIQALNQDHFGLRGTLIATQDLVSSVVTMKARNHDTGQVYSGTGTLSTATGKTYDHWEGSHVKGSSDYTVILYDFGDVPLGDYDILDTSDTVIGTATVQTYDDDYTIDTTGTIHYGHFVISKRVGAKSAFNNNAAWTWWHKDLKNTSANGSAGSRFNGLDGESADEFYGTDELDANFVYAGSSGVGFTVHYSAHAYGTANVPFNSDGSSKIEYTISLWDDTTQKIVREFVHSSKTSYDGKSSIDDHPSGSFFFPDPSPGHDYYMVYSCHIEGGSAAGTVYGNITIDSIENNVYLTF